MVVPPPWFFSLSSVLLSFSVSRAVLFFYKKDFYSKAWFFLGNNAIKLSTKKTCSIQCWKNKLLPRFLYFCVHTCNMYQDIFWVPYLNINSMTGLNYNLIPGSKCTDKGRNEIFVAFHVYMCVHGILETYWLYNFMHTLSTFSCRFYFLLKKIVWGIFSLLLFSKSTYVKYECTAFLYFTMMNQLYANLIEKKWKIYTYVDTQCNTHTLVVCMPFSSRYFFGNISLFAHLPMFFKAVLSLAKKNLCTHYTSHRYILCNMGLK